MQGQNKNKWRHSKTRVVVVKNKPVYQGWKYNSTTNRLLLELPLGQNSEKQEPDNIRCDRTLGLFTPPRLQHGTEFRFPLFRRREFNYLARKCKTDL